MKAAVFTGIMNVGVRTHVEAILQENLSVSLYLEADVGANPHHMLRYNKATHNFRLCAVDALPASRLDRIKHVLKYAGPALLKHTGFYSKLLQDTEERALHGKGSLICSTRLLSQIDRNAVDYDILHAHSATTGRRVALMKAYGALQGKLVVSFKGMDAQVALGQGNIAQYAKMIDVMDACTVQTEYMRHVVQQLGVPESKITKIPSSVDMTRFPKHSETEFQERSAAPFSVLRVITVGRFVEVKGHAHAIESIAQLVREGYDIEYTLIGTGPLEEQIKKQAQDAGIMHCTRFLGNVPLETVYDEMRAHDIFFLPGVKDKDGAAEAMGLVSLEAQSIGLPVVLSRIGGLPETVADENSAVLVESGSSRAAAEGIKEMLRRRPEWPEMIERGRKHVQENFSIQSTSAKYMRLYHELLSGKPITTYESTS